MNESDLTLVELANSRMTIVQACNTLGMDIPDQLWGSPKFYCPFGHLFHADGGMGKAFRIYLQTNSAYCFAGCGRFEPVSLIALDKDWTDDRAAEWILDQTNYVPPDYESQWTNLQERATLVNQDALSEALKVACSRFAPDWEDLQLEDRVARTFRKCLEILPKIQTEEQAEKWLTTAKETMRRVLGEEND